ncbi:MAG: acetylglutamate kinase [Myxococcota bacterium]
MRDLIDKAKVLLESLPYIQAFQGRVFVIKYGGHAFDDATFRASFARDVLVLRLVGIKPVIVHGGGPQIGEVLAQMGMESRFVAGLRVTDDRTMDVVEMVLGGLINKEIVRLIHQAGGRAVGLSGKDGQLVLARRLPPQRVRGADGHEELVDLGRVGDAVDINPEVVLRLLEANFIPVIAPVGVDGEGMTLNLNGDTMAGKLASALHAEKLVLMTDVQGVKGPEGEFLSTLDATSAERLIERGVINGGMVPKVRCGIDALAEGVRKVHILDGRLEHAILLEIFTDRGVGTEIVRGAPGGR